MFFFFLMIRRPPRSTQSRSSAASDVYKRQMMVPPLSKNEHSMFWRLVGLYAAHCDGVRVAVTEKFFTDTHDAEQIKASNHSGNVFVSVLALPHAPESKANLFEKTYMSFLFSYQTELDDYGWFVGQNLDAIICVENLKRLVKEHQWDPDLDWYLGHILNHERVPFNAGGIYVLSRGTLAKYGPKLEELAAQERNKDPRPCHDTETQAEDVMLAVCLKELGITPTDTHDSKGRDAFFNFRVEDHHKLKYAKNDWLFMGKPEGIVDDCCQEYPVGAHNFKDLAEQHRILTKMYDSDSYKQTKTVRKLDWLKAEGCTDMGPNTQWASRSECP
eukprot:TRINITY_DN28180_c0_g1_i2.p1 TRINITY_DN28180_c0_g1~~TRINITY_DN28180_c0_g1_i2.p1  ORF type:complete len:330 (+),score=88.46 TRINITY_DN28180_c0_g1_i2:52-1041(+)